MSISKPVLILIGKAALQPVMVQGGCITDTYNTGKDTIII